MGNKWVRISVHKEIKDMLPQIKKEYLRHHKEIEGVFLSENFLVRQAFKYYLEDH